MKSSILDDIMAYMDYLFIVHGDSSQFHNYCIPIDPGSAIFESYCSASDEMITKNHKTQIFQVFDFQGKLLGAVCVSKTSKNSVDYIQRVQQIEKKHRLSGKELNGSTIEDNYSVADLPFLELRIRPLCRMFALLNMELLDHTDKIDDRKNNIVDCAADYINKNYRASIGVEDISSYCHCSTSSLSHAFKKHIGMSIPQYIRTVRIEKAKEYLAYSPMQVSEIAESCGFGNLNYFDSVFKAIIGESPINYRKRLR